MDSVLKQLETRIDELLAAHAAARARVSELETRTRELEARVEVLGQAEERVRSLEGEREALAERLAGVLAAIDRALAPGDQSAG